MGEIQKVYTQKEVDDLLQEERERVVEEIIDFYKDWTIGGTDENGEYNSKAGIILSPEVLKALTLKYLSKKEEERKGYCTCKECEPIQKQVTDIGNGYVHQYWVNGDICVKCQKLLLGEGKKK